MSQVTLADLHRYAQDKGGGAAAELPEFVAAYFESADPDELQARSAEQLLAIAQAHLRLYEGPACDGLRIRVFNPDLAEDGFTNEHTVIQIVHDDMPFLVDSVTMAVNRSGRTAHWIVHPLLVLTCDEVGRLTKTQLAASSDHHLTQVKSLIFVECDRIVQAAERQALASELASVLGNVDAAVSDWGQMLKRLQALCEKSCQIGEETDARQEGVDFLRWLEDRHFTFLGAREYDLHRTGDDIELVALPDTGLGILRGEPRSAINVLPPQAQVYLKSGQLVLVTKAMTRSTVHRPAWLDCIAVKRFDDAGKLVGESRFLGLYTSKAYAAPVSEIPLIRKRCAEVMHGAAVVPDSHAAKSLQAILDAYPRDELFQVDSDTLKAHALGILRLQERQRSRLFARRDPFGRFTSVLVFVPRDRYNTELRARMGDELMRTLDGQSIEFTPMLTDNPMARVHYLVRARTSAPIAPDLAALESRIARLAQRWEDECRATLLQLHGESQGMSLAQRFANGFPSAYQEDFSGAFAADDVLMLAELSPAKTMVVKLYRPLDAGAGEMRLKIYRIGKVALSDSLPVLERMGARVVDEHPYKIIDAQAHEYWLHDLGLQLDLDVDIAHIRERFEALFLQVWQGDVDNDDLNKLVLRTTLDARSIAVLRAYTRYFKQLGFAFSQHYIEEALFRHCRISQLLYEMFAARFDPEYKADRPTAQRELAERIVTGLTQVSSLDDDRILRQFLGAIGATLRTNAWQRSSGGLPKPYLSFKFDPHVFPGMPEPKPMFEIWVYSPRMEGLHLRNGKVARGGIRWSDRREDFRTEILGLVKAQHVKNTVIVPVGSKGGFILKNPPNPANRDATMAEGIACYRLFLSGLLDLTDNLKQGATIPPDNVVRHDPDDPYLVVAADKGTASFSDIANSISASYGFWLGDAFASGGSVGYDHKKMGITARGAWEAAKRHFRAMGHNTQTQPFTVVGIGDMSGDVFGNGMLLSEHICLVGAFDHRHIFIDPQPDVARSFVERRRLFGLERSSWDDFDKSLISEGGGVYPRSAKSIRLSDAACQMLGIVNAELTPVEVLNALLKAPVDMIYNGGIGTYVKSSRESHQQAGDKAGDAFRVNGRELRCKVFVEGGNLGCTQLGRVEYAQSGGMIYTDAIDNSAGVDCSDHEVNIKILLDRVVEAGDLTFKQRNDLLASMTDDVAHLVLADNYYQTQALDVACHRPLYVLDAQQRLMQWLEGAGKLHRAIEFLPDDEEIARRRAARTGLTAPEGAVVLAYAKIAVFDDLVASNLPDDPYFNRTLAAYFPPALSAGYRDVMARHPLRREIIATFVANTVVNRTGATFINFLAAEAAASTADVVRAYTLAREIFGLEPLWDQIDALDLRVPSALQLDLLGQLISMAQRASRWILRLRANGSDMPTLISRYQPAAAELRANLAQWLPEHAQLQWQQASQTLAQSGVVQALAQDLTALEFIFPALDLANLAELTHLTLEQAARTYFALENRLGLADWRAQIKRLPTDSLWQTQARASARDDVYAIAGQISKMILTKHDTIDAWAQEHASQIAHIAQLRQTVASQSADLAPISVALRELRHLA